MSLILRGVKGSALTHAELDNNFLWLSNKSTFYGGVVTSPTNFTAGLTANSVNTTAIILNGMEITNIISGSTFSGGIVSGPTIFTNGLSANTFGSNYITTDYLTLNGITITGFTFGNTFYGGIVTGSTNFTGGLTANTFQTDYLTLNGVTITGFTFGNNFTGGTVEGGTSFTGGLSANTFTLNGVTVTGFTDYYVTGGTYNNGVLTLNRQDSSFDISGFTSNIGGTTNYLTKYTPNGNSLGNSQIFDDGTNIGIGTSTPDSKLVIKGIDSSSSKYGLKVQNSGGTDNLVVRNDGNVGIGTSTPNKKLTVTTSNTGDGIMLRSSTNDLAALQVDPGIPSSPYKRGYIALYNENSIYANVVFNTPYHTQSDYINTGLNLGIGHTFTTGIGATAKLHVVGSDSSSSNYGLKVQNSSGTDNLVVRNDGNVGIGTSTPTEKLYVNGNTFINGTLNVYGALNIVGSATTFNTETIQAKDNKIVLNYSGNSLTALGGGIDVLSAKTNGDSTYLRIGTYGEWYTNVGLTLVGIDNTSSNYGLKVQNSGGTNTLVVSNGGNVGIGNDIPTEKLDVNGKIKTTSLQITTSPNIGYVLTSDGSGNGSWSALPVFNGGSVTGLTIGGDLTVTGNVNAFTDITKLSTGLTIHFTGKTVFNLPDSPASGNITSSVTDAKLGIIQKIYHQSVTEPTFPVEWKLIGSGVYYTDTLNIIYAEYVKSDWIEYWIIQQQE